MNNSNQYASIYEYIQQYLEIETETLNIYEHRLFNLLDAIAPEDPQTKLSFYQEVFNGAYIFIPDNGYIHDMLHACESINYKDRHRTSSHYSLDPQYSFQGQLVKECLHGTNNIDEQKGSWFQLESHSTSWTQLISHFISYLKFLITGYNQGPLGTSLYTEKNPFIIKMHDHPESVQFNKENENPSIQINEVFSDAEGSNYAHQPQIPDSIDLSTPVIISPLPSIVEQTS